VAASTLPDRVTVVFDGTCGFCTRSIRYLKKIDKHHQVTAVACQIVQSDPAYGLQDVDCGEAAWALTADGRREAGAQAAALIFAVLLGRQWPITIGRLPGLRQVLGFGYRMIARNRYRFPGDTPYCNEPGVDCGTMPGTSCRMPAGS
jgi:predicted DCC family thiol-disulfide oxidoreductase YuxK